VRQALGSFPEKLARLRAFGNFQILFAMQRRDFHRCAKRRLRKTDRHRAIQIRPAPLKQRMLLHLKENIKVARRPAIHTRFALPGHAQPRSRIHARRYANLQRLLALQSSLPTALLASLAHHLPTSLARRARPRNRKESLLVRHLAAPAARAARDHPATWLRASSVAQLAILKPVQLDRRRYARRGLFKAQRQVITQIRATLTALRTPAPSATSAKRAFKSKKVAQNVLKLFKDRRIEPAARLKAAAIQSRMSIAIVNRALLRIGQHTISVRALPKLLLGLFLVLGIAIRMPLQRRFPIRRLDLLRRRLARHAQDFIIIHFHFRRHTPSFLLGCSALSRGFTPHAILPSWILSLPKILAKPRSQKGSVAALLVHPERFYEGFTLTAFATAYPEFTKGCAPRFGQHPRH